MKSRLCPQIRNYVIMVLLLPYFFHDFVNTGIATDDRHGRIISPHIILSIHVNLVLIFYLRSNVVICGYRFSISTSNLWKHGTFTGSHISLVLLVYNLPEKWARKINYRQIKFFNENRTTYTTFPVEPADPNEVTIISFPSYYVIVVVSYIIYY